jgi:hypothetical protein
MHSQVRQKGIAGAVACRSGPGIRFGFDSDLRQAGTSETNQGQMEGFGLSHRTWAFRSERGACCSQSSAAGSCWGQRHRAEKHP